MKNTKKILSLILALILSLSVFAVLPVFATEGTDYTVATDSNTGITTYTVNTATGLNEVVALVNAADSSKVVINITANINYDTTSTSSDLMTSAVAGTSNYTPLGTSTAPFKGTINGGNFTISGLCVSNGSGSGAGLIAYGAGCTVANLTIERSAFYAASNIGGIIGQYSVASSETEISSVNVVDTRLKTSATSGHTNIGGLIGDTDGAVEISNVTVDVDIDAFNSAGGLVGYTDAKVTVNNANVTADIFGNHNLAGILGHNTSGGIEVTNAEIYVTIKNCNQNLGGVVGYSGASIEVYNTTVKADISSTTQYIGGIVGMSAQASTIDDVVVYGDLELPATNTKNVNPGAGGFIGNNTGTSTISDVIYIGNIIGNEKNGGIVGVSSGTLSITNAVVSGDIAVTNSNRHNGGIVGCLNNANGDTTLTNCIYVGTVEKGGPIIGFTWGNGKRVTTIDCYTSSELCGTEAVLIHGNGSGGTGDFDKNATTTPVNRAELAALIEGWTDFALDTEAYSAIFGSSIIAAQTGTDGADTPTHAVRFVATLDGIDYLAVGMSIRLTKVGVGSDTVDKDTYSVYTSVMADGEYEYASTYGSEYLYAIGVNKMETGVYTFEVSSYVKIDEDTTYITDTVTVDYELTANGVVKVNGKEV